MTLDEIDTPALIIDLDAMAANINHMALFCADHAVALRPHAKTHKSAHIAAWQIARGAVGVCCQKVSEAEALVDAGIHDVMVTNQVVRPAMIERLLALAARARIQVCVDDTANVDALAETARRHGQTLDVLVEIDVGAHRCGVAPGPPALELARRIVACEYLGFAGLQAYHGPAQHLRLFEQRQHAIAEASHATRSTIELLAQSGIACPVVAGAGSGTFAFEATSGVYTELQCGSYIFMDADYARIRDHNDAPIANFEHSLYLLTTVMSRARAGQAVCDAGLKAQSVDSGLPRVVGLPDVQYIGASDEHGVLSDPCSRLALGDTLRLIPGHCDPTVNIHDWYVGVRNGRVETLWPVTARGRMF